MYAGDSGDKLPQDIASDAPNGEFTDDPLDPSSQPGQPNSSWVLGDESAGNATGATNYLYLIHGSLYYTIGNWRAYKCPADPSGLVRNYSMNAYMNGKSALPFIPASVNFTKLSAITLATTKALVFLDENPATINDGYWAEDLTQPTQWIDSPAHYHDNGANMSFADGHSEFRIWRDLNVLAGDAGGATGFQANPLNGPDLPWVQSRCSVLLP
jgi:prepilin-type processing-associated H-X9-DG protein